MNKATKDLSGCRVLIVAGNYAGQEGVCLGQASDGSKWAVSPDNTNKVVDMVYEHEFGLLLDMSRDPSTN